MRVGPPCARLLGCLCALGEGVCEGIRSRGVGWVPRVTERSRAVLSPPTTAWLSDERRTQR